MFPVHRRSRRGVAAAAATAALGLALAACSGPAAGPAPVGSGHPPSAPTRSIGSTKSTASTERPQSARSTVPASHASGSSSDPTAVAQLPRGGTKIIGHYRVVAYYGVPGSSALGILGAGSPEHAAKSVIRRARGFAGYGLPVQPAMELIATVAQSSPGNGGDYSAPVPMAQIRRYLAVAHEHHMLLVLDLQPGRASFLSQAKRLRKVLLDPSVGLGLDPEWKVDSGAPGGGRIGSTDAEAVNDVTDWLSRLVRKHHLPDKLEIVHEFTLSMLRNRDHVHRRPGVEVTFHADGFGSRGVKRNVFHQLDFPGHPFGTGFKLFLTQDTHMMGPKQVMKLHPRPDVITYQ